MVAVPTTFDDKRKFCDALTKPFTSIPPASATIVASLLQSPLLMTLHADLLPEARHKHPQIIHGDSNIPQELSTHLGSINLAERDIFMNTMEHSEDDYHFLWDNIIRTTFHFLSLPGHPTWR